MRLFIAIEMSPKVEKILKSFQDEFRGCMKASFPKSFHLTLKFLGDVEEADLGKIKGALTEINHKTFSLGLDRMGVFPTPRRPRVVWAGLKGDTDSAAELQKKIEDALSEWFPKEDRPFVPHLTLGRIKNLADQDTFRQKLALPLPAFRFGIQKFILFSSTLTPEGPIYEPLREYALCIQ